MADLPRPSESAKQNSEYDRRNPWHAHTSGTATMPMDAKPSKNTIPGARK